MTRKLHSFHSFIHGQKHQADKFTPNGEFDPQKKSGGQEVQTWEQEVSLNASRIHRRRIRPAETFRHVLPGSSDFTPQKQLLEVT